jgi:hypothetical protein
MQTRIRPTTSRRRSLAQAVVALVVVVMVGASSIGPAHAAPPSQNVRYTRNWGVGLTVTHHRQTETCGPVIPEVSQESVVLGEVRTERSRVFTCTFDNTSILPVRLEYWPNLVYLSNGSSLLGHEFKVVTAGGTCTVPGKATQQWGILNTAFPLTWNPTTLRHTFDVVCGGVVRVRGELNWEEGWSAR